MTASSENMVFFGESDSEAIQNAIDSAERSGEMRVVIPRVNPRTNEHVWNIDKAILIPSKMTVILDGAHLRLCDGVFDNIFRNKSCNTDEGKTLEGEQHDIRIIGIGNALLDGGNHNGSSEQAERDEPGKYPPMYVNLLIYFHNVRNFEISGLNIVNSRWWSFAFMFCRFGKIRDCDFRLYGTLENQDGIDLRVGCEYITIENITGSTGDDVIALTALPESGWVKNMAVAGKTVDIHDITIRNIMASSHGCAIVRLLNADGAKEYNITISDVKDTGISLSGVGIFIGDTYPFAKNSTRRMGEMQNIIIKNFSTCAQKGLLLAEPIQDLVIENIVTYGKNQIGIHFAGNAIFDNAIIRNFTYRPNLQDAECLFWTSGESTDGFKDLKFENVRAEKTKYLFRGAKLDADVLTYEDPTEGIHTSENPDLYSAYGRYHRFFFGEEITNRPPDNRFAKS